MSTIREVLDRKGGTVLTVNGDVSVLDAIRTMSDANIGSIVILDGDAPVGIFTERDYLRSIALKGRSSGSTQVAEVMSSPLISVRPGESTRAAMETMTECRCRHLVVLDGDEMVGIVSLGDLVKHLLTEAEAEVEHLVDRADRAVRHERLLVAEQIDPAFAAAAEVDDPAKFGVAVVTATQQPDRSRDQRNRDQQRVAQAVRDELELQHHGLPEQAFARVACSIVHGRPFVLGFASS